ncbi:hypothetical protein FACS1894179_04480 [Bacteroidia bacterium]|nr:hypothetical protein FACS1894179_04480 [Bacteroidia bacterium]
MQINIIGYKPMILYELAKVAIEILLEGSDSTQSPFKEVGVSAESVLLYLLYPYDITHSVFKMQIFSYNQRV